MNANAEDAEAIEACAISVKGATDTDSFPGDPTKYCVTHQTYLNLVSREQSS